MKKGKAITLLTIVSIIMAFCLVMSFLRFSYGTKYDYNSVLGAINLDYDMAGGTQYTLVLADDYDGDAVEDIYSVLETLSARLKALGYKSYQVTALKEMKEGVEDYSIRIATRSIYYDSEGNPDTTQLDSDIEAVSAYGTVKFFGGTSSDPNTEIMNEKTAVAGATYMGQDSSSETYIVAIKLTDYGNDELVKNIEDADSSTYYLKITLGEETVLFNASITTDSIISNTIYIQSSQESSAKQLALQISTGGLAYEYEIDSSSEITSIFGEKTALYVGVAVGAFFVTVIACLIIIFRGYGIISALSLIAFGLIEMGMLVAVPGIILSFPGVIGIVLATILAVDGVVVTAKRITEEYKKGKTVKASVKTGFGRAFRPVLNSCVIVEIFALLLFAFTSGTVQCFAITLAIGTVVAFISSVLLLRMFTELILPLSNDKESFLNLKREEK